MSAPLGSFLESGIELAGRYVRLRPISRDDAAMTLAWRLSERAIYLNRGATTISDQLDWIESRPPNEVNFIIELREGRAVGMVSLIGIDLANRRGEPARFLIGEPNAVRGVPAAVEAMLLLYRFAFDCLRLERIHGLVASDNQLMVKWQKFLGMREEGRLRRHYYLQDRFQDAICVGMLREEYLSTALPRMTALIRNT